MKESKDYKGLDQAQKLTLAKARLNNSSTIMMMQGVNQSPMVSGAPYI